MNIKLSFLVILSSLIITGCATKMPLTADEFRQMAPEAFSGGKESFEVNRSVASIGNTFKKMANKCLNKRVQMTESGYMHHMVVVTKYTPSVYIGKNRAELHLQYEHEKGVMKIHEMPEKGYYMIVIDVTGIGKNKSRVEFYRPSIAYQNVVEAVRGWATGKNIGCPDLTK